MVCTTVCDVCTINNVCTQAVSGYFVVQWVFVN